MAPGERRGVPTQARAALLATVMAVGAACIGDAGPDGNAAGGSAAGGSAAGGNAAGGNTAGGNTAGGNAGGTGGAMPPVGCGCSTPGSTLGVLAFALLALRRRAVNR